MIDPLEPRRLLAADFDAATETLNVTGTDAPDTITFSREGSRLRISFNGEVTRFDADRINKIHVVAGKGADNVTLGTVRIDAILDGGEGHDSLSGGEGDDIIRGEGGENYLFGRGGEDTLYAGLQADSIFGGTQSDTIVPDDTPTADDTLSGGGGTDLVDYALSNITVVALVGGAPRPNEANDIIQNDVEVVRGSRFGDTLTNGTSRGMELQGLGGNDTLTGGSGDDTLDGGSGSDSLLGMGGVDHFRSKDGKPDTVDGGSENDVLENFDRTNAIDTLINITDPLLG